MYTRLKIGFAGGLASAIAVLADPSAAPIAQHAIEQGMSGGGLVAAGVGAAVAAGVTAMNGYASSKSDTSSPKVTSRDALRLVGPTTGLSLGALAAIGPWGAIASIVIPAVLHAIADNGAEDAD